MTDDEIKAQITYGSEQTRKVAMELLECRAHFKAAVQQREAMGAALDQANARIRDLESAAA